MVHSGRRRAWQRTSVLDGLAGALEFRQKSRAKFSCTVIPIDQLTDRRLADFDAVGILDPTPLSDAAAEHLRRYVERGGGVAIFLGRNARSATEFNTAAALTFLPAPISRRWNAPAGVSLAPAYYDQPLLSVLRDLRTTVPWDAMPVFEHWVAGPLSPDSRAVIPFSNNKPAVLERQLGQGRVIMVTTPISDPDTHERPPWNLLPTSLESWPFMILIDRLFLTLVQSNQAPLNYAVGQPAQLPVDAVTAERFSLFTPRGTWLELTSSRGQIHVPFTEVPGTYRLNVDPSSPQPHGFSVNLPAAASRLDRLTADELAETLGIGRYQFAKTEAEIVREVDQARVGKEFYPFLLPLLVVVLRWNTSPPTAFILSPRRQIEVAMVRWSFEPILESYGLVLLLSGTLVALLLWVRPWRAAKPRTSMVANRLASGCDSDVDGGHAASGSRPHRYSAPDRHLGGAVRSKSQHERPGFRQW